MTEKEKVLRKEILALLEFNPLIKSMENGKELLIQSIEKLDREGLINLKLSIETGNDLLEKIKLSEKIDPETLRQAMTF